MGLLRQKKPDPLSDRAKALNAEIAALEAQIRALGSQKAPPVHHSDPAGTSSAPDAPVSAPGTLEPTFEPVDHQRVTTESPPDATPAHFNDLGVRKYDLTAAWRRLRQHFHGPPANNPRLINYLAAGSIHGLRPLRYERRVARNRVIALSVLLLFVLWGLIAVLNR